METLVIGKKYFAKKKAFCFGVVALAASSLAHIAELFHLL